MKKSRVTLTAATPKTAQVDILVATTRQPSGNPATLFNGERSPKPYLTDIAVSIPPKRPPGTVQWPKRLPPNPATDFAVTRVKQLYTIPEGRAWFQQHIEGGHALVFVGCSRDGPAVEQDIHGPRIAGRNGFGCDLSLECQEKAIAKPLPVHADKHLIAFRLHRRNGT